MLCGNRLKYVDVFYTYTMSRCQRLSLLNPPETHHQKQSNPNRETQRKIVFLSPRGGTGKSSLIANISVNLALKGLKIGIADLDLKGPSLNTMFNIDENGFRLNDFLLGRCSASSCVIDLTKQLNLRKGGLFLLPASLHTTDILNIYEKGYNIDGLTLGLINMVNDLGLDFLLIDTPSGLDEDVLISMLMGDYAVILARPDSQSRAGTNAIINFLRKLGYGEKGRSISLIINYVPPACDAEEVRDEFERTYGYPVLAVVPFYADVFTNTNREVFSSKEPRHPFSAKVNEISEKLLNRLF